MEKKLSESKCIRKSTQQQLHEMVEHMELNAEFARGVPIFGSNRQSLEEQWRKLAAKLNTFGPPTRTPVEWKKTWADLKSRTKKKIADNHNSILETGGGGYRVNSLTPLEEAIDRTLFLSTAAAPKTKFFGHRESNVHLSEAVEACFVSLIESPPTTSPKVAVVTPSPRRQTTTQNKKRQKEHSESEDELPCSSKKRGRTAAEEQLTLIRRQVRLSERATALAEKHADNTKVLTDAAEKMTEAAIIIAVAAETNAEAAKRTADALEQLLLKFV